MSDQDSNIRIKHKEVHEDGSMTITFEAVDSEGNVTGEFTGRCGPSIAAHGDERLTEAGRRMYDPRQSQKL